MSVLILDPSPLLVISILDVNDMYLNRMTGYTVEPPFSSFDLDLPIACDDEYWEDPDPEKAFKQPPGKPSQMDFMISLLKLVQIMAFALRTIVSVQCCQISGLQHLFHGPT